MYVLQLSDSWKVQADKATFGEILPVNRDPLLSSRVTQAIMG